MAEVVGLAASIAGLLEIAAQITKLSYAYFSDVKNAPKTQKRYLQEVSALVDVLFRVEQAVTEAESTGLVPPRPPSLPDSVLLECQTQLSALRLDLEKQVRRLLWPFQEKELKKHIESLSRLKSAFVDFLSANVLIATTTTYRKLEHLSLGQDKYQLIALLNDLDQFSRTRPEPCPGTGRWFLDGQQYKNWRDGSENLLWCYGSPGTGKSLLASLVVDDLRGSSASMAHYFCDFSSREQQTPVIIFKSLLRQIMEQSTPEIISKIKATCSDQLKLRNLEGLLTMLAEFCSSGKVYIVLDAPDELETPQKVLSRLRTLSEAGCKVLCTSRDLKMIRSNLQQASQLEIEATSQDLRLYVNNRFQESEFSDDLNNLHTLTEDLILNSGKIFLLTKFMLDHLLELPTIRQMRKAVQNFPSSLDGAYQNNIKRINMQSKSKKLLAHRLLSWIVYAKRRMMIEEVLDAFALDEGDEEIDSENVLKADALISLCLGLVNIDQRDHTLRLIHTSAYEYLQKVVLEDGDLDIGKASLFYLSMTTLRNGPCSTASDMVDRLHSLPFLGYAACYLGEHILDKKAEASLKGPLLELLKNENLVAAAFQAVQFCPGFQDDLADALFSSIPTGQTALHVAAFWGLKGTMAILLEHCADSSPRDSQEWTPLHWSCSRGHCETTSILIDNGAKLNARDSEGWTPLFWASFNGNEEIVKLLLNSSADHLVKSVLGWTALHWAVSAGHHPVVKALLNYHLSTLATPTKNVGSLIPLRRLTYPEAAILAKMMETKPTVPLEIAAESGQAPIFDLLSLSYDPSTSELNHDVFNSIWAKETFDNPVANPWRTFLKGKVRSHAPTMSPGNSMLTDSLQGREVTADEKVWRSKLLLSAIRDNKLHAMQLLIECGADVNFDCTSTPLHAAAFKEDPTFCRVLLDHGAKPTGVDGSGYTPLHHAIMNGFASTANALIAGGADVNQRVKHDNGTVRHYLVWESEPSSATPLILACALALSGSKACVLAYDVARVLLAHSADPNSQNKEGLTALHYAACDPYLPLVELLLEAGAQPDLYDKIGQTAFHLMARYCSVSRSTEQIRQVVEAITRRIPPESRPQLFNRALPNANLQLPAFRKSDSGACSRTNTPTTLALDYRRWNVLQVFEEQGGEVPDSFSLTPALNDAVQKLEAVSVTELINRGARSNISILKLNDYAARFTKVPRFSNFPVFGEMIHEPSFGRYELILGKLVALEEVDINYVDPETGLCAILDAARVANSDAMTQALLDHGADPHIQHHILGDSFLAAALLGSASTLRCLLDHSQREGKTHHWNRALEILRGQPHSYYDVIALALQQEHLMEQPRGQGRTILHLAAILSNPQFVSSLVQHGANTVAKDDNGLLPIHYAVLRNSPEAATLLFTASARDGLDMSQTLPRYEYRWENHGFSLDYSLLQLDNDRVKTCFMLLFAVENCLFGMLSQLLEIGADPSQPCVLYDGQRVYLIHAAAKSGDIDIFSTLLRAGANIEQRDGEGWRPLHFAVLFGHAEIVRSLLDAGADVRAATEKWTNYSTFSPVQLRHRAMWTAQVLHLAAMQGRVDISQLLLDRGADVKAKTVQDFGKPEIDPFCGPTALHIALSTESYVQNLVGRPLDKPRLELARQLIEAGADVYGVGDHLKLEDVLKFRDFEDVWDRVREGITEDGTKVQES